MNDIDALLEQYDPLTKSNTKANANTQQQQQQSQKATKQPAGIFFDDLPQQKSQQPKLPKYEPDSRKGNLPLFANTEQRRTTNFKQPTKSSVDQSFDIDAILQGRSIQPQQPSKPFHSIGPAKNSASSRKDSGLSDWLNDDHLTNKTHTQKVNTNMMSKPAMNLNPDDFFSSQDQNENKPPVSTTKASAKQYYMGNSRYKPGKIGFYF
jgi:hypothetical protein